MVVFDIDGVIADVRHRLVHVQNRPKDWEAFFRAMTEDTPLADGVRATLAASTQGHRVAYLTGRNERFRQQTQAWLDEHGLPPGPLVMRPDRDRRPARMFKPEALRRLAVGYRIVEVVDDAALLELAYLKAKQIMLNSPFGVALTKEGMWSALEIPGMQAAIDLENTEENRRAYRSLLATTEGLREHISGVILFEETLFQDSSAEAGGRPLVELFQEQGIISGIKVDQGVEPLAGGLSGESWCTGLKGLAERAARYYERGARFAKWRAVLQISGSGCPSELAVRENAWGLARYARTVQEQGLAPIVEPEILMDGDHDITTTASVQEWVLRTVYEALALNGVFLEGSMLKPSMTCAGAACTAQPSAVHDVRAARSRRYSRQACCNKSSATCGRPCLSR